MLPRDEIGEFAIDVGSLPNDGIVHADPKYLEEDVGGVDAVVIPVGRAGAFQIGPNRRLIFIIQPILKSEAEGTALPHQKKRDTGRNVQQLDYVCGYS